MSCKKLDMLASEIAKYKALRDKELSKKDSWLIPSYTMYIQHLEAKRAEIADQIGRKE